MNFGWHLFALQLAHRLFEKPHIHVEPHDVDVPVLLTAQQVSSAAQL